MPLPDRDVPASGLGSSLRAAAWDHAMRALALLGREPTADDEDGGWITDGYTLDRREVIALSGGSIITTPSLAQCIAAHAELHELAGIQARRSAGTELGTL